MNQVSNQKRKFKILAYSVADSLELKSLFLDSEGSIKNKLENPQVIRPMGWDLATSDRAVIGESGTYIVVRDNRKAMELHRNGAMFLECLADGKFLGWHSDEGLRIHSLAMTELIYNFVEFYYTNVINDFKIKPKVFCVQFAFDNLYLNEKKTYIVPGVFDALEIRKYEALRNNPISTPQCFDIDRYTIGAITYEIVKEIYSTIFGVIIDSTAIPFVKIEGNVSFIDKEQIKKIK